MKKKLLIIMAGVILAITQSFATGTPTVYTDEAAYLAALGSNYYLEDFDSYSDGTGLDLITFSSGDFSYKIPGVNYACAYAYSGSALFSGGNPLRISDKKGAINAFGGYFFSMDMNISFVSSNITVTVGSYTYTFAATDQSQFVGFIFPDTISDNIDITNDQYSSTYNAFTTMDHFYVGKTSTVYQSGDAITSNKDNTIIQTTVGGLGNSTGLIYVGNVAKNDTIIRRGLVQFDLSAIPTDVTIDSVKLIMPLQTPMDMTIEMYKVTSAWTEGTSYGAGGMGAASTTGDVTWLHASYSSSFWTTPGGDYDATTVASKTISSSDVKMTLSSDEMKANVTAWVANPETNFGWLLKSSDETSASKGVIAKFYSKETATDDANKPSLYVYYSTTVTSIEKVIDSDLMVYPIPANNYLNVKTTDKISSISILDLTGKTVISTKQSQTINVSNLSKGIYLIQINTANGTATKQIIKE